MFLYTTIKLVFNNTQQVSFTNVFTNLYVYFFHSATYISFDRKFCLTLIIESIKDTEGVTLVYVLSQFD